MLIANEEHQDTLEAVFQFLRCNSTMIANTGEFLQYGEIVYLIGVQDEQVQDLMNACKHLFADKQESEETHMRMYTMKIDRFMKNVGGMTIHDREGTKGS